MLSREIATQRYVLFHPANGCSILQADHSASSFSLPLTSLPTFMLSHPTSRLYQVQENVLACILRVLDDLDEREAESEILPMLLQAQLSHPTVRISAASKHVFLEESSSSHIVPTPCRISTLTPFPRTPCLVSSVRDRKETTAALNYSTPALQNLSPSIIEGEQAGNYDLLSTRREERTPSPPFRDS